MVSPILPLPGLTFLEQLPESVRLRKAFQFANFFLAVTVLLGFHLIAVTVWALFFVKDLVKPPVHPLVEDTKKKN